MCDFKRFIIFHSKHSFLDRLHTFQTQISQLARYTLSIHTSTWIQNTSRYIAYLAMTGIFLQFQAMKLALDAHFVLDIP